MKKNCLFPLFLLSLVSCGYSRSATNQYYHYSDSEHYASASSFRLGIDKCQNLEIEWISGSIRLAEYKGDDVCFEEDYEGENDEERLHYRLDGDAMKIHFAESGASLSAVSEKSLTISLPKGQGLNKVSFHCVSAAISTTNAKIKQTSVNSVSGAMGFYQTESDSYEINTVSGDCSITLNATEKPSFSSFSSVSGGKTIEKKETGEETKEAKIRFSSVSGNLIIR